MSEPKMEGKNKRELKELADMLLRAANNPKVTDEQLEHLVTGLRAADPHALDTAADACPR